MYLRNKIPVLLLFLFILVTNLIFAQNLIPNGGFEELDGQKKPIGWDSFPSPFTIDNKNVFMGNNSVYAVSTQTTGNIRISSIVIPVEGKEKYYFSIWCKTNAGRARFKIEWVANGEFLSPYFTTSGEWKNYSIGVTAPEGATSVRIQPLIYAQSDGIEVWFDEIYFGKVPDPIIKFTQKEDLSVLEDSVALNLKLRINPFSNISTSCLNAEINESVSGDTLCSHSFGEILLPGILDLQLPILDLPVGNQQLILTVKDADGNIIAEASKNLIVKPMQVLARITIVDKQTNVPIPDALIIIEDVGEFITDNNGVYELTHHRGSFLYHVQKEGYKLKEGILNLTEREQVIKISLEEKPPEPVLVEIINRTAGQVGLTWNTTFETESFYVYKSTSSEFIPTPENKVDELQGPHSIGDEINFIDTETLGGKTYFYIIAYKTNHGNLIYSTEVEVNVLSSSVLLQVSTDSPGQVGLYWISTHPAEEYYIYRSDTPGLSPLEENRIAKISGSNVGEEISFQDKDVLGGYTYFYMVAYEDYSSRLICSNEASATVVSKPVIVEVNLEMPGIVELFWLGTFPAKKYYVYKSTDHNFVPGQDNKLDEIEALGIPNEKIAFIDPDVLEGHKYYYIIAYMDGAGDLIFSTIVWALINPWQKPILVEPLEETFVVGEQMLTFKWKGVKAGLRYKIQIADNDLFSEGVYIEEQCDSTEYVLTLPLTPGNWYWRVRAEYEDVTGPFSEVASFTKIATSKDGDLVPFVTVDQEIFNPFSAPVKLSFILVRPAEVSIDIFTQEGRKVTSLKTKEYLPEGYHESFWDGKEKGTFLNNGVYFLKVTVASGGEKKHIYKKVLLWKRQ